MRGRARNKVEPVTLAPRTIEEAPLRRMDRRALNALRKRRADKHMIAFLVIIGILIVGAGIASIVLWEMFRSRSLTENREKILTSTYFRLDYKFVGLLIIVGPIMIISGISFLLCSLELVMRLSRQIRRVMDTSLLKTSNLHEVKHWIEPELISFGWGQYDFEEEAKLMDDNKMRKSTN